MHHTESQLLQMRGQLPRNTRSPLDAHHAHLDSTEDPQHQFETYWERGLIRQEAQLVDPLCLSNHTGVRKVRSSCRTRDSTLRVVGCGAAGGGQPEYSWQSDHANKMLLLYIHTQQREFGIVLSVPPISPPHSGIQAGIQAGTQAGYSDRRTKKKRG